MQHFPEPASNYASTYAAAGVGGQIGRTSPATPQRFLDALAARDFENMEYCFAPDMWMRALLPRNVREANTGVDAAEFFRESFAGAPAFEVVDLEYDPSLGGRERLRWRLHLRPDWEPDVWHTIEAVAQVKVVGGRMTRMDIVCTGFLPDAHTAGRARSI